MQCTIPSNGARLWQNGGEWVHQWRRQGCQHVSGRRSLWVRWKKQVRQQRGGVAPRAHRYKHSWQTKKTSDCCQKSILWHSQKIMLSNENSETAIFCKISLRIRWYFFQISVIKIDLSTGEKDINIDKKSHSSTLIFCNFLNSAYSTTQFTTTSICHQHIVKISDKLHK
mgnify:CR=1 FL=1